jgi:hypothetical protein
LGAADLLKEERTLGYFSFSLGKNLEAINTITRTIAKRTGGGTPK